jgi:hypothetical protein
MVRRGVLWSAATVIVALAGACGGGDRSASPAAPGGTASAAVSGAAADGVTLKVNPPALTSPVGGTRLTDTQATLTFQPVTGKYVQGDTFTYRVELQNAAGTILETQAGTATSYKMKTVFETDTTYKWRARAEFLGSYGPWSPLETFKSAVKPAGYLNGSELYDSLDNGRTVGTIVGPSTWIPGVGLRLDSEDSYIEYQLPQTLGAGEYSALVTNIGVVSATEEPKDRVISMRQGRAAINDNPYRMTVEKRGNGATAWRFLTGSTVSGSYIETGPSERIAYAFRESATYFYRATWGGGAFRVQIIEGGIAGKTIYDGGKPYKGQYTPSPHMVYAGSPYAAGDRGEPATVPGMIIRQIWVSPNPRPAWAQ